MKKLQNNFTTPEQSKRLLELGVPADSADCRQPNDNGENGKDFIIFYNMFPFSKEIESTIFDGDNLLPCWSVGRLMEIYDICRCYDGDWDEVYGKETYIETYVSAIEEAVLDEMLDFSKLED